MKFGPRTFKKIAQSGHTGHSPHIQKQIFQLEKASRAFGSFWKAELSRVDFTEKVNYRQFNSNKLKKFLIFIIWLKVFYLFLCVKSIKQTIWWKVHKKWRLYNSRYLGWTNRFELHCISTSVTKCLSQKQSKISRVVPKEATEVSTK